MGWMRLEQLFATRDFLTSRPPISPHCQVRQGTKGQFAPIKETKNAPPDPF